ncbi:MAG: FecR domain-containing protein, partial [Merismopedia sp. SIO2A8]|nr:FecR domain-containing protein [Merismopedia sp. SIO2A8]
DIEEIRGEVIYHGAQSRSAQIGDRLNQIGQGITTLDRSSAVLEVDSTIGRIRVAANTALEVDQLTVLQDGAKVTVLKITQGQVRIQARRFTNPNTRLEVHSPSGIAAVRGTDFGVSVTPDGNMAIATETGLVEVSAQSQSVQVAPGQVSTIQRGEAPTSSRLMDRQLGMDIQRQELVGGRAVMKIKVDPANRIVCNGEMWVPDRDGILTARIPSHQSYLRMTVHNPLGETREHVVWVDND